MEIQIGTILEETFDHNAQARRFWKVVGLTPKSAKIAPMQAWKRQGDYFGKEIYSPVQGTEDMECVLTKRLDTLAGRPVVKMSARNWLEIYRG